MPRSISILLTLLGAGGWASACYSERPAPPAFRYHCDGQDDCRATESCIQGLCEVPCAQATADTDCDSENTGLICLNGICASTCAPGSDVCPAPRACLDLGVMLPSGGGGFLSPGNGSTNLGLCASKCGQDSPCPDGETCLLGFCAAQCTSSETCKFDLECQGGLCLPASDDAASSEGSGGQSTGTGAGSSGSESTAGDTSSQTSSAGTNTDETTGLGSTT